MDCQQGGEPGRIRVFAPAKLNLTLEVGPPRDDGYHPIASVMVPISLTDQIVVSQRDDDELTLEVVMDDPQGVPAPADQENLAWRAARLLQEHAASETGVLRGASIQLIKRIPVAAGLAGGSTDAAAVLVGLNQLWGLRLGASELAQLGERLGADVPFCIRSKAGLVEGIGEQYTPLAGVPSIPVVLINPRRPLSTGSVFQRFDAHGEYRVPGERTMHMVRTLFCGDLRNIAGGVYNDLERPAKELLPEIDAMERSLLEAGALAARVTGSGPTVFGIAESEDAARRIAERCQAESERLCRDWWIWWGWAGTIPPAVSSDEGCELSAASRKG